jgi:hypothetical protein
MIGKTGRTATPVDKLFCIDDHFGSRLDYSRRIQGVVLDAFFRLAVVPMTAQ